MAGTGIHKKAGTVYTDQNQNAKVLTRQQEQEHIEQYLKVYTGHKVQVHIQVYTEGEGAYKTSGTGKNRTRHECTDYRW